MYLKSIEVQGFKSFANKIVFEFHNGITGIVGPNGSGKSNVADAVRWVLGEQRVKQLRGGTMQDVIFSGTENRKPLSFASVAITMDNADHKLPVAYEEVTVTRRLYRSGESEYLLNGTTCRLKDIQEMFYDTGIGKEGYSIIGQGQIDRILSTRPEEARELFDEATGIVKFKKRKKTAEKKLDDEKQNLLRVNDILTELEKQVGPLERQAEKAKEYLKKKETLKEFEIHIFLMEMENIKKQLKELEETRKITQDQLDETKASFENTKLEYERIEKELEEIEQKIDAAKEEATSARVEKQQMKGQAAVLKEQVRSAQANAKHYAERLQNIERDLTERQQEKETVLEEKQEQAVLHRLEVEDGGRIRAGDFGVDAVAAGRNHEHVISVFKDGARIQISNCYGLPFGIDPRDLVEQVRLDAHLFVDGLRPGDQLRGIVVEAAHIIRKAACAVG